MGTVVAHMILSRPRGLISCHLLKGFVEDDISSKVLKFVDDTKPQAQVKNLKMKIKQIYKMI